MYKTYNIWMHKNRVTGMPFYIFMVEKKGTGPKSDFYGYPWAKSDREDQSGYWTEAAKGGFDCELLSTHQLHYVAEAKKHEWIQSFLGIGVALVNIAGIGPTVESGMRMSGVRNNGMKTLKRRKGDNPCL
jgi:hypothetical protein